MSEFDLRPAEQDDYDDVAAFTEETWPERDGGDYIPRVYHDWIETDDARTLVADAGDDVAGICQCVLLSEHEAWGQGIRVNPDYRGIGVATDLTEAVFDWAREQGATVCRNMVFSWNDAGLGQARAVGFDPATEFRWATPEPDADAAPDSAAGATHDPGLRVTGDPEAAWSCFRRSDAARRLGGLALDLEESWAVAELTRDRLRRAADSERVFAIKGTGERAGTRAASYRVRSASYGDETSYAEYGVAAWDDLAAARSLFAAIARDAAALDVAETRVLIPETVRHVSDVARVRAGFSDEPDFVLEADLT
jgi:GNAT superfamily N-acetyltransferase